MCGIAGIFSTRGPVTETTLQSMGRALAHRGPDDTGYYLHDTLGLVHTRLSIIDLSTGHQPLVSQDQKLVLVANGEIYNYIELRQELEKAGHRFQTHSDCETILYAYREYGLDFLGCLQGMFAFALYDADTRQLILARDRLGIKPLFYMQRPEGLYFASELKALLAQMPATPEINPEGLAQFLQLNFTTGDTTLVQGIRRLPPGEAMILRENHQSRFRYWSLRDVTCRETDFDAAAAEFDALMETVIPQHMRTDVPFGLYLSGGVDSSVLLAMLSKFSRDPLHTYSVGFTGASVHNELPAAEKIARRFGTRHTVLELDQDALLQRLPYAIWSADELMGDYANLPVSLLAERTARDIKVVFSGEGGDEVFAGYGRYRMPRIKYWLRMLATPGTGGFRTRGMFSGLNGRELFAPPLLQAMRSWRNPILQHWRDTPSHWSHLQRMQYVDIQTWLPDDLLVKADRMLMAWGVEGRVPFLDHRIVEFGLSLPDDLKVSRRNGKIFLKRWAERHLPREILWERKRGFTVPVRDWLSGPYLDQLEQALLSDANVLEWFQPGGIRNLVALQRKHGRQSQALWALLQFMLWHRMFLGGNPIRPQALLNPLLHTT